MQSKFYEFLVNIKLFRLTHRQTKLNAIHDLTKNDKKEKENGMKSFLKGCTYLRLSKQYYSEHTLALLGHLTY